MAKLVYDPTPDRKKKSVKVFSASPKEGEQTKTVQYDPKRGPKGTATVKKETKATEPEKRKVTEKPEKPKTEKKSTFTDEQFIETLKAIGKPASSREVSDKLGIADPDVGRAIVRREMEKLISEKKVEAVKSEKKTIGKLYKLP
jgi:hypothetical protein